MFIVVMVGTLVLLVLLRTVHTVAQDGLPTPEGQLGGAVPLETPAPAEVPRTATVVARLDTPDPDLCDVEPRTIDGMLALIATPTAQQATPSAVEPSATPDDATATDATTDRPASAAIIGQIQRTVREIVACGNAGDLLRVWAFFSDNFVRSSAANQPALFNSTILTARARAQTPRTDAMPKVTSVLLLSDDRVSAVVAIPTASPMSIVANESGTVTLVFVQVDDHWLIDEVRESDGTGG
jgi:hypothetical protein